MNKWREKLAELERQRRALLRRPLSPAARVALFVVDRDISLLINSGFAPDAAIR